MNRMSDLRPRGCGVFLRAGVSAVALVLAAVAVPGPSSADTLQLSRSVGVGPTDYSAADLILLRRAAAEDDGSFTRYLRHLRARAEADGAPIPGGNSLASLAGVAPGTYSAVEMVLIIRAREDDDGTALRNTLRGGHYELSRDTRGRLTPSKQQLAGLLGVSPRGYTLTELVMMRRAIED
ncbi:hypothetical protein [Tranquillimonas alkanivorans]|uniref:Uncharacterized protein n=1 Tax=Tranquillimonas alkanivorans TaxID=441119 RepID=A0A1I5TCE7_9RHOB|nr:hypothetical protein [Tranquillimonas alkanivorans]SFP80715.1 hypothetical protein SAMN04488047_11346 [Tranquillimonas alkanivorans]